MENIEVEIRSFIDEEKYLNLLSFFKENAKLLKEDYQESYYFDGPKDLRIQKNDFFAKIWLKEGKIHDEARKEIEIQFDKEKFNEAEKLFIALGYQVKIKWFRKRFEFEWNGIKVDLDYTKGYGFIIELEKLTSEDKKETALTELKAKLAEIEVELTPREVFEEKFKGYEKNWKTLIEEDNFSLV